MKSTIPYNKQFDFAYEQAESISPLIRRIVARNPNFFTFYGTNTYLVGQGEVALIDPGPDDPEHIDAIVKALGGEQLTHILITHTHYDHWPAYRALQDRFDARTYGYEPDRSARFREAQQSEQQRSLKTQEKYEIIGFSPDIGIQDKEIIRGRGWTLECVFTPGHASNHMCYQLNEEQTLFSGDHVMGWSTSVISPPSGNMREYMKSLNLLLERENRLFLPGHGPEIPRPRAFVKTFIQHRNERRQQILDQLKKGVQTIPEMVSDIYREVPTYLHPAAERSTLAAMEYLVELGEVNCDAEPTVHARYYLV